MTRSEEPKDCVFCVAQSIDDGRQLIVHAGSLAYVILNKFPYNAGHLMVVPVRHAAALALLTRDELNEMALLTQLSERVLTEVFNPTVVGEVRVLPEELPRTADRLRPVFKKLA